MWGCQLSYIHNILKFHTRCINTGSYILHRLTGEPGEMREREGDGYAAQARSPRTPTPNTKTRDWAGERGRHVHCSALLVPYSSFIYPSPTVHGFPWRLSPGSVCSWMSCRRLRYYYRSAKPYGHNTALLSAGRQLASLSGDSNTGVKGGGFRKVRFLLIVGLIDILRGYNFSWLFNMLWSVHM